MYNYNYSFQRKRIILIILLTKIKYKHIYTQYCKRVYLQEQITHGMNRIKEILKEKGITQQELANRLGVTRISIVKTLAGNPSEETLERIANALDVPTWQLFVSPKEMGINKTTLVCPNCGVPLELKIKEKE